MVADGMLAYMGNEQSCNLLMIRELEILNEQMANTPDSLPSNQHDHSEWYDGGDDGRWDIHKVAITFEAEITTCIVAIDMSSIWAFW